MVKKAFKQKFQQRSPTKSKRKAAQRKPIYVNLLGLCKRVKCFVKQTYQSYAFVYLVAGLLGAYGLYIFWLGLRPIVVIVGLIIVISAMLSWQLVPSHPTLISDGGIESDLLAPAVFYSRLQALFQLPAQSSGTQSLYKSAQRDWERTRKTVESIHTISMAIAQQDSLFIPDLLDTLHTVLALAYQYKRAFAAIHKIKTLSYQRSAQKQLSASSDRITQTHQQLQELHDQLLTENITAENTIPSVDLVSGVSLRLQTLINIEKTEANKTEANKTELADS